MRLLNEIYCAEDTRPARCVCDFLDDDGQLAATLVFAADFQHPDAVRYLLVDAAGETAHLTLPDRPFARLEQVAAWLREVDDTEVAEEWGHAAERAYLHTRPLAIAVARRRVMDPDTRAVTQRARTIPDPRARSAGEQRSDLHAARLRAMLLRGLVLAVALALALGQAGGRLSALVDAIADAAA